MSSTVGHALSGMVCLSLARATLKNSTALNEKWWVAVFALLACLPDLDFLVGYFFASDFHRYHGRASHSLIVVLLVSSVTGILLPAAKRRALLPWIFVTVLSHVVIDLFTGPQFGLHESYGVSLLWPFDEERIRMPVSLFLGVQHATMDALVGWHNVFVIALEVLMFVPLLILLERLLHKRPAAVLVVNERSI